MPVRLAFRRSKCNTSLPKAPNSSVSVPFTIFLFYTRQVEKASHFRCHERFVVHHPHPERLDSSLPLRGSIRNTGREPRPGVEIPKTIAFVDSLSTIGRLRFTTADNEKTYDPFRSPGPPYYSWFYRPARPFVAVRNQRRDHIHDRARVGGSGSMAALRDWCTKCFHGEPAVIGKAVLKAPEFRFLRTATVMNNKAIERATPPGLPERLSQLPDQVGNLDRCPFFAEGICWWSSQDPGARLDVGLGHVFVDQNRAIPYTSRTQDAESATLHVDVNDYFVIPSAELWERSGVHGQNVSASTLIASPRIEVGVDFRNVRDGVTHKALRSASSFQQKVGRVGREDGSDSMIVTFLAQRTTDAHFAHHPARLIDAQHLDPIPLKADNPDVIEVQRCLPLLWILLRRGLLERFRMAANGSTLLAREVLRNHRGRRRFSRCLSSLPHTDCKSAHT